MPANDGRPHHTTHRTCAATLSAGAAVPITLVPFFDPAFASYQRAQRLVAISSCGSSVARAAYRA